MNSVSHTTQQYRHGWGSPGQTVGNSRNPIQALLSGENPEKLTEPCRASLRLLHILSTSPSIENLQQPSQSPRYILLGFTYNGLALILKCEEATAQSTTVAELSDYYPYLGVRQTSGTLDDRKGALGKDYDSDTGLTQDDARYYKSNVGRFISQDQAFWQLPKNTLSDPQQLNSYSYARNNPIALKDVDGKKVEAYAKAIEANSLGTHVFLLITPDRPQDFGLPAGANWTIGGYAGDKGNLIKAINAPSDRSVVDTGYSIPQTQQGALKEMVTVQRPDYLTDTGMIKGIMGQYNDYQEDAAYDPFARKGYNSNNLATSWLIGGGVGNLPWGGNAPGIDPGYGVPLPSNYLKANGQMAAQGMGAASAYGAQQGYQATLNFIQNQIYAIQGAINAIKGSNKGKK